MKVFVLRSLFWCAPEGPSVECRRAPPCRGAACFPKATTIFTLLRSCAEPLHAACLLAAFFSAGSCCCCLCCCKSCMGHTSAVLVCAVASRKYYSVLPVLYCDRTGSKGCIEGFSGPECVCLLPRCFANSKLYVYLSLMGAVSSLMGGVPFFHAAPIGYVVCCIASVNVVLWVKYCFKRCCAAWLLLPRGPHRTWSAFRCVVSGYCKQWVALGHVINKGSWLPAIDCRLPHVAWAAGNMLHKSALVMSVVAGYCSQSQCAMKVCPQQVHCV